MDTIEELRKFIREETIKEIGNNMNSALIYGYVSRLEKENEELKNKLEGKL